MVAGHRERVKPRIGRDKLRLNEWTSREGERRSKLQVVADAVQFLGSPKKAGDPDGGIDEPAEKPAVGAYRRKAS